MEVRAVENASFLLSLRSSWELWTVYAMYTYESDHYAVQLVCP